MGPKRYREHSLLAFSVVRFFFCSKNLSANAGKFSSTPSLLIQVVSKDCLPKAADYIIFKRLITLYHILEKGVHLYHCFW